MTDPALGLAEFFARARQGQLTGIRCGGCGTVAIPPKEFCPGCGERRWTPEPLGGTGTIASFTVIRVAPRQHARDAPYAVAVVAMPEGVSLLGRVVDIPFDRLAVGLPVRFRPLVVRDQAAIGFGPA